MTRVVSPVRRRQLLISAAALLATPLGSLAQPFPSKPVRLVNPFPPGGPLDIIGRTLTERLSASLGTPVFVWYGLLAPAGTPRNVVARINADTVKALKDQKVAAVLAAARIFVIGNTPEEFAQMIRDGYDAWGRVIRDTGVKVE